MDDQPIRPIFVVGSPRSGTSILTWCLGQHRNILPLEETNWIGTLAVDLGVAYALGTGRAERSQLSAMGVQPANFYAVFGEAIHRLLTNHRREFERLSSLSAQHNPAQVSEAFQLARGGDDPKSRWVDGTPEYAFYIAGLLKLFPEAKFIHIVRDVDSVVRSMLGFATVGGAPLAGSEQEAYVYWLRAVRACFEAEQAFGADTVLTVRYADLVSSPRRTLQACLAFLSEPFESACLAPLKRKINSSNVPVDAPDIGARTDPGIIAEANQLSREVLRNAKPRYAPNAERRTAIEQGFAERIRFVGSLEQQRRDALEALSRADHHLTLARERLQHLETERLTILRRLAAGQQQMADAQATIERQVSAIAALEGERLALLERATQAEQMLATMQRQALARRIREVTRAVLPSDAVVLVVSKGDEDMVQLGALQGRHFPQVEGGVYAGAYPADSAVAIDHLEALRSRGATHLLFPSPALWWLEHYTELREHLERSARLVVYQEDVCVIYSLEVVRTTCPSESVRTA